MAVAPDSSCRKRAKSLDISKPRLSEGSTLTGQQLPLS
jgi:hypothetical protein